jgi:O-antigen/teichoic acid export membrane protein
VTHNRNTAPLRLRWNFSWVLASQGFHAISLSIMFVVLARLLTTDDVGMFALGLAISTPVFALVHLDLRTVQATDARLDFSFGHYLALGLATTPLGLVVMVVIVVATRLDATAAFVVLAWGVARAIESITFNFYGVYQRFERMERMAVSLALRGGLALASLTAVVWATDDVVLGTLSIAASWLVVLVTFDVANVRYLLRSERTEQETEGVLAPLWDRVVLRRLGRLALPAGMGRGVVSLLPNITRYQVQVILSSAALGVYAAIGYVIRFMEIVSGSFGQALEPRLAKAHAAGRLGPFRSLLLGAVATAVAVGVAIVALTAMIGEPVLRAVFGAEYARGDVLIRVVIGAVLLLVVQILMTGIVALRRFGERLVITVIAGVVTLVVGIWLVREQGIVGAANTSIIGLAVSVVLAGTRLWVLFGRVEATTARRADPTAKGADPS